MKSLVIAEKPSVAKDLAQALNCSAKKNYYENNQYIITYAFGHLVTLADPDGYDKSYQKWDLDVLPIIPDHFKYVIMNETRKQFNSIKSLYETNKIKEVIIATDAGREGELVARLILLKLKNKLPIKRLWISSMSKQAIVQGFKNLKNGRDYDSLYEAALARAQVDWLVGINATRALTTKYNASLSCGRVQTPTLMMIAHQQDLIAQFKPQTYYTLQTTYNNLTFNASKSFYNEKDLDAYLKTTRAKVINISQKKIKSKSQPLYDLTTLQVDAYNKYGYSASETLNTLQNLYEYHKLVTYPRTDSRYLTTDLFDSFKERIQALRGNGFDQMLDKLVVSKNNPIFNNAKVSDHHALIPTEQPLYINELSQRELHIYKLIVNRFMATLLADYEAINETIVLSVNGLEFKETQTTVINLGYKELDDTTIKQSSYKFTLNEQIPVVVKVQKKLTTPPSLLNEATLLQAMENPSRYLDDQKANQVLKATGGIGTVATRAEIIEKLYKGFLIEKRNNGLVVTSKGRQLLDLVPVDLKSPLLTSQIETKLQLIEQKKLSLNKFIKEVEQYTKELVEEIKTSDAKFKHDNLTTKKCEKCGSLMLEVNGKKGKMLVCSNNECKHRVSVSMTTNARCPECMKKLELVKNSGEDLFVCKGCGYREKLSSFKERKTTSQKADKKDIQKYLNSQNKVEKTVDDSPFAALLNLKFDK